MMTKKQRGHQQNNRRSIGYDDVKTQNMWREAVAEAKKIYDPERIKRMDKVYKLMDAYLADTF